MYKKEKYTEQKIKEAARKIFQEKGFSATKIRDISEEADANLALVNYYFKSKKKLFDIIMFEALDSFFTGIVSLIDDTSTTLHEKIALFVNAYMDVLTENQNMVYFILNAVREHPEDYIERIGLLKKVKKSIFVQQFEEGVRKGDISPINPVHFMLNIMGLTVFPFIGQSIFSASTGILKEPYFEIIEERRRLIPLWVESMLNVK